MEKTEIRHGIMNHKSSRLDDTMINSKKEDKTAVFKMPFEWVIYWLSEVMGDTLYIHSSLFNLYYLFSAV